MEEKSDTSVQRRYELILDSLADGVFTVDLNWRITSFNRGAEKITGIQRARAIGRHCFEVFRADVCEVGCAVGAPRITEVFGRGRACRLRLLRKHGPSQP